MTIVCFPVELYFVTKANYYARHPEKFSREACYRLLHRIIKIFKFVGRIETKVTGIENIPQDKSFLLVSNHQGKYDAIGIVDKLPVTCGVVMDYERSFFPVVNEFITMSGGKRLKRGDLRQQVAIFSEIAEELKNGSNFLLFPEGGYSDNKNNLQHFHSGAFRVIKRSGASILPVAIYDSYKPFGEKGLKKVVTKVAYLEPIEYETIKGKNTEEIRDIVVERISAQMKIFAEEA